MAPKNKGENTKKVAGNAKKAEAAAQKQAAADKVKSAQEDAEWSKGAKSNSKAEAAAAKQAEAARKKAEKDALLKAEEAALPSKPKGAGTKTAQKKTKGIDSAFASLDTDTASSTRSSSALNATNIDDALDALDIASGAQDKVDRHPERRFKAAYTAYEERRLDEMKDEKGLRRQQKIEQIRKEFEKSPENPFNQVAGRFDSTKDELREIAAREKEMTEARLAGA
ncbi:hypothetical protein W97_06950 [Coniosporium apollinis CBS 100218]|uniref:DUF1014 domain-containing protein n=1 Tax=Coniosporium apollinis (strain CBS 100218) TaxID=1168221 RepID=R7Z0C0_CONA1|nr:uncharacterized protein W97_06950 [Coniosporium apollinis CBS 100218]EON67582.1 hypothetical protein W97_06950 [Coniosporium apollinis CBS 100218]